MWRKIIEKMYDPKDFEVLESRFYQVIEDKKQFNKTNASTSRMGSQTTSKMAVDAAIQAQLLVGNKKMTREEIQ